MMTALMILVVLILVAGVAVLVSMAVNGDPFAAVWVMFGGLGDVAKLVAALVAEIVKNLNE